MIARCLVLGAMAIALMGQSSGGLFKQESAPVINYQGAKEDSLDLMVDQPPQSESQAPAETEDDTEDTSEVPTEGVRTAKDPPPRLDLSRPLQEGWEMDPVLLNRRQAGEPLRPGDDETNQMFGIQLRKEF